MGLLGCITIGLMKSSGRYSCVDQVRCKRVTCLGLCFVWIDYVETASLSQGDEFIWITIAIRRDAYTELAAFFLALTNQINSDPKTLNLQNLI